MPVDIAVRSLSGMITRVYCEPCADWQEIKRYATAAETVGIVVPPQIDGGLFDQPPF